ncbi:UNVERIFIED_CONTAM: hypothetical protein K2H54_039881 [Gekko kuhli]
MDPRRMRFVYLFLSHQDYCGPERHNGSFSIITENVPCGTTGVTCSKSIKVFLGRTELKLEDKQKVVITRDLGNHVKYWTRTIGLYLVVEASNGVMLIWDKKTTMFVKLTPNYKGKVCGLCGNFDDKANNDFTTRSQVQANNALDFGNSWKRDSKCPDVDADIEPCDQKLHRKSWAEKECSLIKSEVFAVCHPKVDPNPFYEACVHDACACDSGGDCECFCTAVAAYAQECIKTEACVFWRTPDICPIFCDYYNPTDICEWHYEPCGREIMTCKILNNIATNFSVPYLEGCYPRCPPEKPFFSEETFTCEDLCGCYVEDIYYPPGSLVPTDQLCVECICIEAGTVNCSLKREPEPASPPSVSVEENKNTEDFKGEVKTDSELKVIRGKPEFEIDVFDTDMQNREEERPSEFKAEILQLPFVTVTSNKPVIGLNAGTKAEAIGQVETEKEESELSLQLPASKQTSSDIGSASSEEKKLSQNTCLLESVSAKLEHVSATVTSTDTLVEQTVTVEANRVEIEKSKENVSDPSKENPEKLQIESFLLEDVEAKESKESRAQITMLKVDSALQKEREEIDLVVTETNVDPKKDNDFTNECQLCQFDTETVTMIEQLVDQRPRKAQLGKHFPDSGNSENKQRRSREDQSRDDFNATVHHPREDDDHSPAAGHHRDDHSPADSGHPRDDPSPAVLQPRDDISLTEDFT